MPRIDESSLVAMNGIVSIYHEILSHEHFVDATGTLQAIVDGSYDDDPGRYGPVDLCKGCTMTLESEVGEELDHTAHPSYYSDEYRCYVCGRKLWEDIDG